MKYAIIVSTEDPAGINIKECLLSLFSFENTGQYRNYPVYSYINLDLYTIDIGTVFADNLDKGIDADIFIFATRHQSKEGIHSLSCHSPGNFGKAEYGGKDSELCVAPARMLKKAYLELLSYSDLVPDHNITLEATHHGPIINKPVMFIEIGSTEEHWGNKVAGEIIAKTIVKITSDEIVEGEHVNDDVGGRVAFAIGGPHYCNNFNKDLERSDIMIGHICPKYALINLDKGMIEKAIARTYEKVDCILLDWKGLGREKERLKKIFEEIKIEVIRTDKIN